MSRTFVFGGARSGESAHAESLAAASGKEVIYIATADAGDAEIMVARSTGRTFLAYDGPQGIWVRLFTRGAGGIRCGLPADEAGWRRLETALQAWKET